MKQFRALMIDAAIILALTIATAFADTDLSFAPTNGSTTLITGTAASVSGNLASTVAATKLRVLSAPANTVLAFFRCTPAASPTATTADTPIAPGQSIIIDGNGMTACAVISLSAANSAVYFTWGAGGL
jgi:hypothetical protein